MYGVFGNVVHIDLSTGKVREIDLDESIYKKFFGGYGLGVWYIYKNLEKNIDPLGEKNILGILPGMLNGTNAPMAGRMMAATKSPLTGTWGDSNVGGHMGPELKKTGHDGLFISGISKDPVYIYIEKDIEILDAKDLWGKTTTETEKILRERHQGSQVLSIGQAGENVSLISAIITDYGRALGRSGVGAVMGSKRLKAIVAKGTKEVSIYNREKFREIVSRMMEIMNPSKNKDAEIWHKYGTIESTEYSHLSGDTPIKNWKGIGIIDFGREKIKNISKEEIVKDNVKSYGCASCPVACGAWIKRKTKYGEIEGHRLEYEGTGMLGGLLLNGDLDSVAYGFELANRYGYDVISLGAVIGFAMECYELGIIKKEDLGFELNWGDGDAVIKTIELMVKNEGIGKILNMGVKRASEILHAPEEIAIHVHGQELPAHDPKYLPSLATTYVADPTPGRHTAGGVGFSEGSVPRTQFPIEGIKFQKLEKYVYTGKGYAHAVISNIRQVENSLGFCIFSEFGQYPYVELVNSVTGWNLTDKDLLRNGERIQNLRQLFNIREGLKPSDFRIPNRAIGIPPQKAGPLENITVDVDSLVKDYFNAMEWDINTGMPSERKIRELDLEEFIKN